MPHEVPGIAKVLIIAGGVVDGGEIALHIGHLGEFARQLHSTNPDSLITVGGMVAIATGAVIDKIAKRHQEAVLPPPTRRTNSTSGPNPMHDGRIRHTPKVPTQ